MPIQKNKNKTKNKFLYSVLSLIMLSMVGISTVSINKTYAADVYPTITNTNQETLENSEPSLAESVGDLLGQFATFVKNGIEKNNAKYSSEHNAIKKHEFNIIQDTNKLFNLDGSNLELKGDNNSNNNSDNFIDIANDPDKYYINYISDQNLISQNNKKFNPNNFIRLHEFSKLLVNSYRYSLGYNIEKNIGLTNQNYFTKTMPKYYNTAYEMGLLAGVDSIEDFERFIAYSDVQRILSNFNSQYPEVINESYINNLDIENSNQTLRRGEVCRVVVKSFVSNNNIINNSNNSFAFSDISSHKYGDAINQLSKLDLINTEKKQFYPDNRITRGEFIDMFINSYIKANNLELAISNFNFNIDDLDYNSEFAPYIVYSQEKGLTNYFFETKRGKTYVNLNKAVTKHEAYYIIAEAAGVQINYDATQADQEYITRGEVSQLIIDSFRFSSLSPNTNSQLEVFVNNIKSLTETKKLLSFLF